MPSHAPLSSRDGRLRSSSLQQGKDAHYYSNEDIELLHRVVSLGQELLPTLPKRDKLPTTALFRAADVVFPQYGLDPDGEDKLSRIIFLVGGMRSTDNLLDRFRTVLAGMGIELEYVQEPSDNGDDDKENNYANRDEDDKYSSAPAAARNQLLQPYHHQHQQQPNLHASPPSPQPSYPPSVHSAAPSSAGGLTTHSGVFPVAPHVNGRRRRNSDSIAQFAVAAQTHRHDRGRQQHEDPEQQQEPLPSRQHQSRRSDSQAPPLRNYKEYFEQDNEPPLRPQHSPRPIDPWLSEIPQFPDEMQQEDGEDEEEYEEADYNQHVSDGHEDHEYEGHEYEEDRYGHDRDGMDGLDDYTRSLEMLRPAPRQQQHEYHHHPNHPAHDHADPYSHTHNYEHHQDLPYRTRPLPQPKLAGAHHGGSDPRSLAQHRSDPQSGASKPPTLSSTGLLSPQSRFSLASDFDAFPGASDTTMQEDLAVEAGPPPKVDPLIMAKVADTFFMRFAFLGGRAIQTWRTVCAARQEQERYAAQIDRELVVSEAILVWSELAGTRVYDMAGRTGEVAVDAGDDVGQVEDDEEDTAGDDDASAEIRLQREDRERRMRRAVRVDTITTLATAFCHWHAMAGHEAERTKVARRHLLRRKVFGAWREQTVRDSAKVDGFVLGWAVQRWTGALRQVHDEQSDNAQLAVWLYRRHTVIMTFWTWLRVYQERRAVSHDAAYQKTRAVNRWHARTLTALDAEDEAASRDSRGVLRDVIDSWSDQAQTQALKVLLIEEQEREQFTRAALQDWRREVFCRRQLRTFRARREAEAQAECLDLWRQQADNFRRVQDEQDRRVARDAAMGWRRAAALAVFRANHEHDLKVDAARSWVLAERLAFLRRYRDDQLVRKAALKLQWVFQSRRAKDAHDLSPMADRFDKTYAMARLFSTFRDQKDERDLQQETADRMARVALATTALDALTQGVAAHADMGTMAHRGAFYVAVAGALDGWPAYARAAREARLRATYRQFRREVKRRTAADCFFAWRDALDERVDDGGLYVRMDHLRRRHDAQTVFAALDRWARAADDRLFHAQIAAEADAEAYLSRWRLRLGDCAQLQGAAAEHDAAVQLAARWDAWELQAVQARARQHTAAALFQKTGRRLARRALAAWQRRLAEQRPDLVAEFEDDDNGLRGSYGSSTTTRDRQRWLAGGEGRSSTASLWRLGSSLLSSSSPAAAAPPPSTALTTPYHVSSSAPREDEDAHESHDTKNTAGGGSRAAPGPGSARPASVLLHPMFASYNDGASTSHGPSEGHIRQERQQREALQNPVQTPRTNAFAPYRASFLGGAAASSSVPAPGRAAATTSTTASTSAALPRRLHRSTAAGSAFTAAAAAATPLQRRPPWAPVYDGQPPAPDESEGDEVSVSSQKVGEQAGHPSFSGHQQSSSSSSLQHRLRSAARLADSVRLGPMSEFDEADEGGDDGHGQLRPAGEGDRFDPGVERDDYADGDASSEKGYGDEGGDEEEDDDDDVLMPPRTTPYRSSTSKLAAKTPTRYIAAGGGGGGGGGGGRASSSRQALPLRTRALASSSTSSSFLRSRRHPGQPHPHTVTTTTPMGPPPSERRRLQAAYYVKDDHAHGEGPAVGPTTATATPFRPLAGLSTTTRTIPRVTFARAEKRRGDGERAEEE